MEIHTVTNIPMDMPDMGEYQLTAFQCFEDGRFWSVWDTRPRFCADDFSDDQYLDWEEGHPDIAVMAFDDYRLDKLREGDFVAIEGSKDAIHDALFLFAMVNGGVFSAMSVSPLGCQAVAFCRIRPILKGVKREILEVVWYDFAEGVPLERSVRVYDENGIPEYAALPVNPSPHDYANDWHGFRIPKTPLQTGLASATLATCAL